MNRLRNSLSQSLGLLNLDSTIHVADAIIVLQVRAGITTSGHPQISWTEVNQDGRIGLFEAIFVLQKPLGLR